MKRSRAVAFLAAEDDIVPAAEASAPRGVPIWGSLAAGWVFFFTRFGQIAARLWLSALILAFIEYVANSATATPFWLSLAYLALYLFAFASLYALALSGPQQRPVIAGFALGPDELRFLLATLIYFVIAGVLILGAYLVGAQLAKYVSISGDIATLSNPQALDSVRWFSEMPLVQKVVLLAPIAFSSIIVLWFSTRYVLVPLHVIAVRKLAIFDALALTKHNSWRLLLLMILLAVTLVGIGWAILDAIAIAEHAFIDSARSITHGGTFASGHHSLLKSSTLRSEPRWISPVARTFLNLMAASVIVGTLSNAYRKVAQR